MFSQKLKPPTALVIGSVLVDIIVDSPQDSSLEDQIGKIDRLRLGGCAFNIFKNLRHLNVNAQILTALKKDSPLRVFVELAIRNSGARRSIVLKSSANHEGIFVAFVDNGKSYKAVTSTVVDYTHVDFSSYEKILKISDVIVIDMSLTQSQIEQLIRLSLRYGVPIVCNGTSDGRVKKLRMLPEKNLRLHSLVCSEGEAMSLFEDSIEKIVSCKPSDLCRLACCDFVLITRGAKGYVQFDARSDAPRFEPAPHLNEKMTIQTTLGAGDALTACYAAELATSRLQERSFSFDHFVRLVGSRVPEILNTRGATEDSNIDLGSLGWLEKLNEPGKSLGIRSDHWQMVGAVFAVLAVLVALLIAK